MDEIVVVRRARAIHRPAGADVLVGHVHAARVLGRRAHPAPTCSCSTRCLPSATRQFQRKCFGKIAEFKRRGGTIVFVSHDAQAVERLCDRAVLLRQGELAFDGSTREAIAAYRRLLGRRTSPEELEAGLREWGSGEARIVEVSLVDDAGDERAQFASGEAVLVRAPRRGRARGCCPTCRDRVARRRRL